MANAFQKPPFQNTGFQTPIFSVKAFQQCAFQYPGFQTDACEPEESSRSGVWRLWLYQLQEADNKKRQEAQKEHFRAQVEELQPKNVVPIKKKSKPVPEPVKEPPVKLKPLYRNPAPTYNRDLALEAWAIASKSWIDVLDLQPLLDAMEKRVHEEEEDIEMLLLAA